MKYNKFQLGYEIAVLSHKYPPAMKKWPWAAPGVVVPDFLESLKEMCWMIYEKTSTDGGQQIMGREWDTDPYAMNANIMGRVMAAAAGDGFKRTPGPATQDGRGPAAPGIVGKEKNWGTSWEKRMPSAPGQPGGWQERTRDPPASPGYNHSPGARGNVLKMDRWHPTMNDCWVLGGVHRSATFKLVSPRTPDNIWNVSRGVPVVTAREMLGLLRYGYRIERNGSEVLFIPDTSVTNANITDYWDYIQDLCRDKNAVNALIHKLLDLEVKKDLHEDLRNFDRSRLQRT